jgi:hypothetical protein
MKTEQIDNVWPRDIISVSGRIGRVLRVQPWYGDKNVAEVLFSWHETGIDRTYLPWNASVAVMATEELGDLFAN